MKIEEGKPLGKILTRFRKEEGIATESRLGELLHETQQSINKKMQGLTPWRLNTMVELSKILNFKMILENGEMLIMKNNENIKTESTAKVKKVKDFGRYSIIEVYSNSEDNIYGNIYTSMNDALAEREEALSRDKDSTLLIGYCLHDNNTNYCPDDAKDWHDTIESAEWEYNNFYEYKNELESSNVRESVIELWREHKDDIALDHVTIHKDRYYGKTIKAIQFDLDVNYDISGEYEWTEEKLNIKLASDEYSYVAAIFRKTVMDLFKNGFSHLL